MHRCRIDTRGYILECYLPNAFRNIDVSNIFDKPQVDCVYGYFKALILGQSERRYKNNKDQTNQKSFHHLSAPSFEKANV